MGKNNCRNGGGKFKRVNKDDLRAMIDFGKHSKSREGFVLMVRDSIVAQALQNGYSVIVDDTNLNPAHERRLRQIAAGFENVVFSIKDFTSVSLEECIDRDSRREHPVGSDVIRKMAADYFPKVHFTLQQNTNLPAAIICDIDGTIAIKGDRDIYDGSKVHLDSVNEPVMSILKKMYTDNVIIMVSGRDGQYEDATRRWLIENGVPHDFLFMRKPGDRRKDSIVKEEIFDNEIRGSFFVRFVLDDRNQVVDMWRRIGLPCFQVNPGDF